MAIKADRTIMHAHEEIDTQEGDTVYHVITYSNRKEAIFKTSCIFFPHDFNMMSLTRLTLEEARKTLKNAAEEQGLVEFKDFTIL
ncbi:hypothetical protein J7E55_25825 [Bacillus sp. ISL-53]|nr:hypothetical protein [Bacillus sp. ISL-53]